ncbi:FtsX-like permease family protein [Clostridium gasigenes]|uniref:ABC transporter permease n=1 Tax=Clostridium gasigenes TaxID=94869 RepID=UPI00143869E9|nr:ABC transporter permease [Clostridium gasigenes]NKF07170.1 FtsX-like permease family protein [Clostridium gasigenes]QSW18153.1 FtsX-like permease family protein [Clostridium gasigenes]
MAIYTILLSNLKKRKGSFISIFILVLIISMTLSTVVSVVISGKERFSIANKEANSPDITNMINKEYYSTDIKTKLEEQEEVKTVEESEIISYSNLQIGEKKYPNFIFLTDYKPNRNSYNLDRNNNKMKEPKDGEIYLPIYFKEEFSCEIGQEIIFKTEECDYKYKIADFFEDPIYGSSNIGIKRFFINNNELSQLLKVESKGFEHFIIVDTFINDNYKEKNINEAINNINKETGLENFGLVSYTLGQYEIYTFILPNIISALFLCFCILLLVIVTIVIGYSVNSNIEMDYVSLGILKSIGFKNKQIRLILLIQYMLMGILASGIGMLSSGLLLKSVGDTLLSSTGLFWEGNIKFLICLSILGALLFLLSIFIILITRKITKISPVRAIAFGHAPVYFSSRINISLDKASFIPLSMKIAVKQIITHSKQYVMLFIVVGILTSFIISIGSISNMIIGDNAENIFSSFSSDISISYNNEKDINVVNEIIKEVESEASVIGKFMLKGEYRTVDNRKIFVMVVDDLGGGLKKPLEGRNPKYSNEVMITTIMSDLMQKSIGDKIVVENLKGEKEEYIIVGLNQNTQEVGENIIMLESGMRILEPDYTLKRTEFKIENKANISGLVEKLKVKYKDYEENVIITDTNKIEKESMKSTVSIIEETTKGTYIIAIIVVGLISILVCSNTLQKEKIDIGILKAQGFTTKQLRGQFTLRFLIVALVGSGLGIILNILCNDYIMSLLFKNAGLSNFVTVYSIKTLMEPVAIICTFTCLFAWLVTMKIKKVTPKNLIQE